MNKKKYLPSIGLVTITLCIENIIGLDISLPRKTVNWTMQNLEAMGIEVRCNTSGLGEKAEFRKIYLEHIKEMVNK